MLVDIIFTVIALVLIASFIIIFCLVKNKKEFEKIIIASIVVVILFLYGIVNYDAEKKMTLISPEYLKSIAGCIPCGNYYPTIDISNLLALSTSEDEIINLIESFKNGQNKMLSKIKSHSNDCDIFKKLSYLIKTRNNLFSEIEKIGNDNAILKSNKIGELYLLNKYLNSIVEKINNLN